MIENIKKYTEANRVAWNQVMPKHQAVEKEELDKYFSQPGYIDQEEEEFLAVLNRIKSLRNQDIYACRVSKAKFAQGYYSRLELN